MQSLSRPQRHHVLRPGLPFGGGEDGTGPGVESAGALGQKLGALIDGGDARDRPADVVQELVTDMRREAGPGEPGDA